MSSIESLSPFRHSAEIRDATDATITGSVPAWLRGELMRTCPAIFTGSQWRARHWFDGLCMIYAFRIGASSVSFQSRFLESEAAQEIAGGPTRMSGYGTPTGRSLWQRLVQPIQRVTDNTNVNIVKLGDDIVALTEGDRQMRIDAQSLRALGPVEYERDDLLGALTTPHPHYDFADERVVNVATKFGLGGVISIYEHAGEDRRRQLVGSWRTKRVPYFHSFELTPNHAILIAHPFTVKPLDMLWSNRGYIDHFEWRPEEGTRLIVMDRATGATTEYETDPFFVFHTVNAFERDGETVLDLLSYPSAAIVDELRVDRMIEQLPDLRPSLVRIVLRPGQRYAKPQQLSDARFEYPSTNYRRVHGHAYRYAWGASDRPCVTTGYASSIVKVDVRTGMSVAFSDSKRIYGEPIFVSRPGGTDEDDGVLLSVGACMQTDASSLVVLDAKTMALLASAEVPAAIPLGFHGSFFRGAT